MHKKKLLITGGMGNLGSWILEYALQNFEVTVLSRTNTKIDVECSFELIIADISDKQSLQNSLDGKEFNYVIHAASVNDGFVEGYSDIAYKINAFGTRNLIESLDFSSIEHFIYLSTFQIYGTYSGLISEKTIPRPLNDYGLSHLTAEYFLYNVIKNNKFSIIRLTNSYGCPKDINSNKWYLVLNDLCKSAIKYQEIRVAGNGKSLRDFIWMGDVSKVLLKLMEFKPTNDIYNLSYGESLSIQDIANKVKYAYEKFYDKKIKVILNLDDKSNPSQSLIIDSSKIKNKLNISYSEKFTDESIKIFKLLTKT